MNGVTKCKKEGDTRCLEEIVFGINDQDPGKRHRRPLTLDSWHGHRLRMSCCFLPSHHGSFLLSRLDLIIFFCCCRILYAKNAATLR